MFRNSIIRFQRYVSHPVQKNISRSISSKILVLSAARNLTFKQLTVNNKVSQRAYASASTGGFQIPDEVKNLNIEVYHNVADQFLEELSENIEDISQNFPKDIPDVDLSHGVLTVTVHKFGTYVINKQPPNKQIWLASPISGPNRYDYYKGEWVSLRDNTKILDVLKKELTEAVPNAKISL
ncbi:hypothetical protein TPHA_0C03530 [Tetrapisispora phaffii CBS 4417]|uniref:ferroxidase n=1 Tax=Tetrapisispora phaffii (strain ATCC 24235 / CBS 4417 / NBRC 1672 / NRRL Y-8282 / UCD 70-5) TaxID=1071381 RepID=G8BQJ3_TETPH|nr:hypothetical protein TPHA_0C03530 [Tetrapisispora phaffii CBS 4417]CCE62505.1 hypothetical protein TPHA_0C03530 [Tetrapisispora phaffii CBS 4417]